MRKIQIVPLSKIEGMRKYLNEYLKELEIFDYDIKFDEKGEPVYKWFDLYWQEKSRYPFYFYVDGKVAGFALLRELDVCKYEIAEFYVFPEYRKDGNALWLANEVINLFEGEIELSTKKSNPRAVAFWNKFVNQFEEKTYRDSNGWLEWTLRKNNFKTYKMGLQEKYFNLIKNGTKIYEGRLNTDSKKIINVGDTITFLKEPERKEELKTIVLDKLLFGNFEQMANSINKKDLGFEDTTKEEMIKLYRTIYRREDEEEKGVLIFKIRKI